MEGKRSKMLGFGMRKPEKRRDAKQTDKILNKRKIKSVTVIIVRLTVTVRLNQSANNLFTVFIYLFIVVLWCGGLGVGVG